MDKIINLIKTGNAQNIALAKALIQGQSINIEELIAPYTELLKICELSFSLGGLISLLKKKSLNLSRNQLTELPESIGKLSNLQILGF